MNIAVTAAKNEYAKALQQAIEATLPNQKFTNWTSGEKPSTTDIELLLAMGPVTDEDMQALPKLQFIQTLSDGYETVDTDAATELGIYVSFCPAEMSGNGDSVAEFAIFLLLAAARRVGVAITPAAGQPMQRPGNAQALLGKTVCIVGVGSIGSLIAQRLTTFGVNIIGVDRLPLAAPKSVPTRHLDQLHEALAESDFVILCIRADDENSHLFNAETFAAMKPGSALINIARGSLVDEKALFDAVQSGHLGGAALDVLEHEPVAAENPLLTLPQVFITPHQAGLTDLTSQGTAQYIKYVVTEIESGRKLRSILNHPKSPRLTLKES